MDVEGLPYVETDILDIVHTYIKYILNFTYYIAPFNSNHLLKF